MSAQSYATRAEAHQARRAESSVARVEANRANSQFATGPRTEAGKAAASANAIRHGFTANLQRLDPRDSPTYQQHLADLTTGLAPANPAEEFLMRDLAMLKSRLDRLEAAEYAAVVTAMGENTDEATAYLATAPNLATLEKTDRFLRRNYMQTWSRLERMQRERKNEERERKQAATAEHQTPEATREIPGTKQSQSGSTDSNQKPIPSPTAAPAPQPTMNFTSPQPAPSPANGPTDKTKANAA